MEGGRAGRGQDNFLPLGWETILKADEQQVGQRYEDVERKQDYFNSILFHKSGPAIKQHTNQ
jgi:hypothetical protein